MKALIVGICGLLLAGTAPGPKMEVWIPSNPVSPGPMPDRWYITDVTTEPQELRGMCHDCLPLTISERMRPGLGLIVFYDAASVPALLKVMEVATPEQLVGKHLVRDDERNPVLAPIVSAGRKCSENLRQHPQNIEWC